MAESITGENKEQNRKKPPLSRRRIACEILAGLAVAVPVLFVAVCVFGILAIPDSSGGHDWGPVVMLFMFALFAFPILYGPASAIGVYLVGSRGKQTGSFLLTLVAGFLGGLFTIFILYVSLVLLARVVQPSIRLIGLLIPPIVATRGFNLTRRYKEPPSS